MAIEDIQSRLRDFEEGQTDVSPDDRGTLRDLRGFISRALQGGDPESAAVLERVGKDWALDLLNNRWTSLSEELIRLNHRLQDTYTIHNGTRRRNLLRDALREIFDPAVKQAYHRAPATDLDEAVHRALRSALVAWVERQGRLSPLLFRERLKTLHLLTDDDPPRLTGLARYFVALDTRKGLTFLVLCDLAVGGLSREAVEAFLRRGRSFKSQEEPRRADALTVDQAEWLAAIGVAEIEENHYFPTAEGRLALNAALGELGGPWSNLITNLASQEYLLERVASQVGDGGARSLQRAGAWYGRAVRQSITSFIAQVSRVQRIVPEEAEDLRQSMSELERDLKKLEAVSHTWERYVLAGTKAPEIVAVEEVVRTALSEWGGRPPGLRVEVDLEPNLPGASGSREDLAEVVKALLENAAEAVAGGDSPVIRLMLQGIEGGSRVRLAVSDNGTGVLDGDTRRIFEPGFTTRDGRRGMGLALVKRTVEVDFQGEVFASGNVAGGMDITLLLPTVRSII